MKPCPLKKKKKKFVAKDHNVQVIEQFSEKCFLKNKIK